MGNGVLQAGQGRTECGGSGVRFGAAGIPEQVPGSSNCNGMAGAEAGFRGAPPDDCPAARAPARRVPRDSGAGRLASGGVRPARPRVAGARRAGRGPEHHPTRPCFPPSRSSKCTWGDLLHPEGSPGFHRIMTAPLQHHPPDPETISMPSWAKQQPRACGNSSQRGLAIGRLSAMAYLVLLFAILLPSAGNAQGATDGVCGRTQQVRDELVRLAGAGDCASVTADNLAEITNLELENKAIASLQAGDFAGLTSLVYLRLSNNQLSWTVFPAVCSPRCPYPYAISK